ncbi:hypothetical protein AB0C41_10755 [Micromonospora taraxaci]|uniref:hypothetical protein n=1 Tax=Micromonospora taraxaci TaxID=1316803 RepID=UPI0033C88AFB
MRRLLNPDRLEAIALVLILLAVGGMAGAASFTHVKDWTMLHAPAGTGDWFGWSNAVISELTPAAALLVIRRRRRRDPGASVLYPLAILIAAVALSLAAQIAVANDSFSSRLLSSVPALAFLALSKLILSGTPTNPAPAPTQPTPAPTETADIAPVDVPAEPAPVAVIPQAPIATPAPAAVARPAFVSSVVQTPRNGHVFTSEVTR